MVFCLILCGCGHNNSTGENIAEDLAGIETPFFIDITADEAKEIINYNDNIIIIDISSNYSQEHLPGAINILFSDLEKELVKLDKSKTYLVYGDIESYSQAIASRLAENNFSEVYRLEGGIKSWIRSGYEVKN